MILLDTNVISVFMKPLPEPFIMKWINQYDIDDLWLTSITIMELQYGIDRLPKGKKRNHLHDAFHRMLQQEFRGRILEFDAASAIMTGKLLAKRKQAGMNPDIRDGQIAGMAKSKGATLATRNIKDFASMEIRLVNPWEE